MSEQHPAADLRVVDNTELSRFEGLVGDDLAGIVEYIPFDGGIKATHTVTMDSFEGQGVASRLVRGMLDQLRAEGRTLIPSCAYVRKFLARHPEYGDLVVPR